MRRGGFHRSRAAFCESHEISPLPTCSGRDSPGTPLRFLEGSTLTAVDLPPQQSTRPNSEPDRLPACLLVRLKQRVVPEGESHGIPGVVLSRTCNWRNCRFVALDAEIRIRSHLSFPAAHRSAAQLAFPPGSDQRDHDLRTKVPASDAC